MNADHKFDYSRVIDLDGINIEDCWHLYRHGFLEEINDGRIIGLTRREEGGKEN